MTSQQCKSWLNNDDLYKAASTWLSWREWQEEEIDQFSRRQRRARPSDWIVECQFCAKGWSHKQENEQVR